MKQYIFVFDVEATSLHGEGFAVGAVVADKCTGKIVSTFSLCSEEGKAEAGDWVKENVIPLIDDIETCPTTRELRDRFYQYYLRYKDIADIYSDVNFPVETNFLSAIVADSHSDREWHMPYPLKDISTIVDVNIDRNEFCGEQGLVKHHPLHDAIASLQSLLKFLSCCSPIS